jgi:hypothetical protein
MKKIKAVTDDFSLDLKGNFHDLERLNERETSSLKRNNFLFR